MRAVEYISLVGNGKLEGWASDSIKKLLARMEGKRLRVTIAVYVKKRTDNQNRFLHGVFLPAMYEMYCEFGNDFDIGMVKEIFKEMFCPRIPVILPDGTEEMYPVPTSELTIIQCEEAMEKARAYFAPFGQALPYPNEAMP
jgi:hypothetical protein